MRAPAPEAILIGIAGSDTGRVMVRLTDGSIRRATAAEIAAAKLRHPAIRRVLERNEEWTRQQRGQA